MLPCSFFFFCGWVNCGSGGIPAPPETCVLCFPFLFYPHFTLPFVLLILTATPTHGPVVTISQLLSALVGKTWMHLCVLQDCLYDQPCFFLRDEFMLSLHGFVFVRLPLFCCALLRAQICVCTVVSVPCCRDDKQYFVPAWAFRNRRCCALKCKAVHGGRVLQGFSL